MGTKNRMDKVVEKSVEDAVKELEALGDEIRLKLHLAGMEANTVWTEKLEPRLFEARLHVKEAKAHSGAAIRETIKALKDFSAAM